MKSRAACCDLMMRLKFPALPYMYIVPAVKHAPKEDNNHNHVNNEDDDDDDDNDVDKDDDG